MEHESRCELYRHKTLYAKNLRQNMTEAEVVLWKALRNRHCAGMKFKRQVPMYEYIVDFLCREHRLIVEVDGGIHVQRQEQDQLRDDVLRNHGYRILRFKNDDVLTDLSEILKSIAGAKIGPL